MNFIKEFPRMDLISKEYLKGKDFNLDKPLCLFYIGSGSGITGIQVTLFKNDKKNLVIVFTLDTSSYLISSNITTIIAKTDLESIKESLSTKLVYLPLLNGEHYYCKVFKTWKSTSLEQSYITWKEIINKNILYKDLSYTDMFNWALDEYNLGNEKSLEYLFKDLETWLSDR